MSFQARNLCVQSIKNVLAVSEKRSFRRLTQDGLRARLDYLIQQWALFCSHHNELMDEHPIQQQMYNELYAETEQQYLTATVNYSVRIRQLQQLQDQANELIDDDLENMDNASAHDFYEEDVSNVQNEHDNERNAQNYVNHPNHRNDSEQSFETVSVPVKEQIQLQPIYISCGSKKSVENTWGHFDGDLTQWQSFYDGFKSAVHDDKDIPNSRKFQLLQSSLRGKAAQALAGWRLTDDNYSEALERLIELHARQYHTSHELLRKFHNLQTLDKASGSLLQKMSNVTHEVIRQLRAMKYPVEHYDLLFVHEIHDKLDPDTRKEWELYRKTEFPALSDMLKFLDWQAKALIGAQSTYFKEHKDSRKRPIKIEYQSGNKRAKHDDAKSRSTEKKPELKPCVMCKDKHGLHRCAKFLKLNLFERRKVVREHKLCHNCLRPSHFSKDCPLSECFRCHQKHNSTLCNENPKNNAVTVVQSQDVNKKPKTQSKTKTE